MAQDDPEIPAMKTDVSTEIDVTGFAFGGRAVGRRSDGKVCFVRGAVPGERVEVRLTSDKKNFAEGILTRILKSSPQRLRPECPNPCPGCSYAHIPYEMELDWKQRQFRSFAEKARLQSNPDDFLGKPTGAAERFNWRNKIRLSLEFQPDGTARAGYRGEDNHTLIEVSDCLLAVPEIRTALRAGEWKSKLTGHEKSVTFRWTPADGVRIYFDRGSHEKLTDTLPDFGTFEVGENSFFQINPRMAGNLAAKVCALVMSENPSLLAELYCGCGVFSVLCAEMLPALSCVGIELDADSIRRAKHNAELRGVNKRTEFLAGDSARTFRRKFPHGLPANSLLLVDPPRTGLDEAARKLICRSRADSVLYVSCSPDTLFRDLAELEKASYRIVSGELLDMFPATAHFESITLCERIK